MNNLKFKRIFILVLILLLFKNSANAKIKSEIIYKLNNEIITNVDLENEKKFLLFLNPNLKNLSLSQIENISENSLKNRKIKEIELKKFFDLEEKELNKSFLKNFILNANYSSEEIFLQELAKNNLKFKYFEKNFIIDNLWREFIYNKYKSQVQINVKELKQQIQNQKNEIEELNLSEILFKIKPNLSLEDTKNEIYEEIKKSGFEAAASIYSISDSKDYGGKLGWIKSSQISKNIYSEIKKEEQITSPIKTQNGYLIIKINEKRKIEEKIDIEIELKKLINLETEKELNKLGYIYFNKIKKRIFVSEN